METVDTTKINTYPIKYRVYYQNYKDLAVTVDQPFVITVVGGCDNA